MCRARHRLLAVADAAPGPSDVADAYMRFRSGDGGDSLSENDLLFSAADDLLDGDTLELYVPLESDGEPWMLLLAERLGLVLLRLREKDVEALILGTLSGSYREEWSDTETGRVVTMLFEDGRLPGGRLKVDIPPPRHRQAFLDASEVRRRQVLTELRKRLREWAFPRRA
jgi:hypothetical protein